MTEGQQAHQNPSLIRSLCNSASAAAIAEGLTLPLDTAKVRLQLQNFSHDPVPRYRGPLQTVGRIMKDEGATAPFKGLVPGLHRQLLFTGLRLGLYDAIKGLAATVLGSPWDVIGTRLMAPGKSTGKAKQAQGLFPFIAHMLRTEGIGAFYKGFVPNFARIGSFNIVLWLSYEQIKKL
ncbi:hypothetical protein WJX79_004503 [Trebouxia sp. C0005]